MPRLTLRPFCLFALLALTPAGPQALAQTQAQTQAAPPTEAPRIATPEERAAALRMEPLARAAFFNREFERNPTDAEAGLALSDALRALGRYNEAADAAHRVLLFAPDNYDALLSAAKGHIGGNNGFYGIDSLQRATELRPRDWRAYSLLGVALDQVKRSDEAWAMWAKALTLSPDNPAVLTNQAMFLSTRGDLAQAEQLLRRALTQPAATIQVRQNLALVLGLQGKLPEAERLLRQDLPPDIADANLLWLQTALKPAAPQNRTWDSLGG
ncbi:MAG: tetratricopeptide repeat protein [Asticcacaulis sp.]